MLGIIIFCLVLAATYGIGQAIERKHFQLLAKRELRVRNILIFNEKIPPREVIGQQFYLVSGSAVMSCDYFKQWLASIIKIFGGRMGSFENMMDLGRREAIVRMKEEAARKGATMIFNVRLETSMLNEAQGDKGLACAELFAYGTAWGPKRHQ